MIHVVRGVILAAGASSRMGRPKAALPLTDRADTFLSRLVRTFLQAGVPDLVIVTGADAELVRAAAGRPDRRVRLVHNPRWQSGQLSSLVAALTHEVVRPFTIQPGSRGAALEAVVVNLVDVPMVSVGTVVDVVREWRRTRAPIVRPARGDQHGHPVVFDRAVFDQLRTADPQVGAKAVVRAHTDRILNVPSDDDGAFLDIDTDAEYRAIVASLRPPPPAIQQR